MTPFLAFCSARWRTFGPISTPRWHRGKRSRPTPAELRRVARVGSGEASAAKDSKCLQAKTSLLKRLWNWKILHLVPSSASPVCPAKPGFRFSAKKSQQLHYTDYTRCIYCHSLPKSCTTLCFFLGSSVPLFSVRLSCIGTFSALTQVCSISSPLLLMWCPICPAYFGEGKAKSLQRPGKPWFRLHNQQLNRNLGIHMNPSPWKWKRKYDTRSPDQQLQRWRAISKDYLLHRLLSLGNPVPLGFSGEVGEKEEKQRETLILLPPKKLERRKICSTFRLLQGTARIAMCRGPS